MWWMLLLLGAIAVLMGLWLQRSGRREAILARRLAMISGQSLDAGQEALFLKQEQGALIRFWLHLQDLLGEQHARTALVVWCILLFAGTALILRQGSGPESQVALLTLMFMVPWLVLRMLAQRRLETFESQFPAALDLISRAISTGSSVQQSFEYVADTLPGIVGAEFRRIVDQLHIGTPVQDALQQAGQRLPSIRLRYFSVAVVLNLESGGQLSEVLQKLSRQMQQQMALAQKLQTMTAEPRSAARIVSLIPVLMLIGFYFFSPGHFVFLFTDPVGHQIMTYVTCSILLGLLIIQRMTRLDN